MNTRRTDNRSNYVGSALLAVTTLVVAACGGGGTSGGYGNQPMPAPQNTAPAVMAIADRSADQDTAVGPIDIGVADAESGAGAVKLTARADGSSVFPEDGVVLAGSGATRTLTLTPLEAMTGTATITVTATDPEGLTATRSFKVAVNARTASMWSTAYSTIQKTEGDGATALNGFTYQQDADDPTLLGALLPPVEPIAGIE